MALKGAEIFFVPQSFTLKTGREHLEILLRAISIENGCYTISSGQIGIKPRYEAPGKTMIIDPWGNVIARALDKPCVITAEVDLDYLKDIRKELGVFRNRRDL